MKKTTKENKNLNKTLSQKSVWKGPFIHQNLINSLLLKWCTSFNPRGFKDKMIYKRET